jgi:sodium-dependent phosphate cotransporter
VLVLLPLELLTGFLQKTASALTSLTGGLGGAQYDSPIKGAIKAGSAPIKAMLDAVLPSPGLAAALYILVSVALIFAALLLIVKVMRAAMARRVESVVSRAFGRNALLAMIVGVVVTVMVQSSSITTSLLVPLAGAGVLTLRQAFPITLGANVGTTVTAMLAALAATDQNASAGLTIALVHLLFNVAGIILVYPVERIRNIPLAAARHLADVAAESRKWALLYVAGIFYAIPALFALVESFFV